MRRNVRRLNREVSEGIPGLDPSLTPAAAAAATFGPKAKPSLKPPSTGPKLECASAKAAEKPKKGRSSRKAANLAELQRYFQAAIEAAKEVLEEQGPGFAEQVLREKEERDSREAATKAAEAAAAAAAAVAATRVNPLAPPAPAMNVCLTVSAAVRTPNTSTPTSFCGPASECNTDAEAASPSDADALDKQAAKTLEPMVLKKSDLDDLAKLAEAGIKPLDSPSRLVAINLASGNPLFREKLRKKLEATGGLSCRIDASRSKAKAEAEDRKDAAAGKRAKAKGRSRRRKRNLSVSIDDAINNSMPPPKRSAKSSRKSKNQSAAQPDFLLQDGLPLTSPFLLETHTGMMGLHPTAKEQPSPGLFNMNQPLSELLSSPPPPPTSSDTPLPQSIAHGLFDLDEAFRVFPSPRAAGASEGLQLTVRGKPKNLGGFNSSKGGTATRMNGLGGLSTSPPLTPLDWATGALELSKEDLSLAPMTPNTVFGAGNVQDVTCLAAALGVYDAETDADTERFSHNGADLAADAKAKGRRSTVEDTNGTSNPCALSSSTASATTSKAPKKSRSSGGGGGGGNRKKQAKPGDQSTSGPPSAKRRGRSTKKETSGAKKSPKKSVRKAGGAKKKSGSSAPDAMSLVSTVRLGGGGGAAESAADRLKSPTKLCDLDSDGDFDFGEYDMLDETFGSSPFISFSETSYERPIRGGHLPEHQPAQPKILGKAGVKHEG
eukprot:scaffold1166_cov261-Pinguiococcus_pyrenoidosus.AAC.65